MTRPPFLPAAEHLQIPDRLLQDLLSALRRHDAGDTTRLLDTWSSAERTQPEEIEDGWADDELYLRYLDDPLTAWVHAEATLHVAGGRYENALCLVECYRRPLTAEDMALFNPTGDPQ